MANKNTPQLVAPFLAERYSSLERLNGFLSPPYDVITGERRARLAAQDHNIVHLILPQGNGDRYERAKSIYERWKHDGVVVADKSPGIYVVQQEFTTPDGNQHVRTGFIGGLAVEPYSTKRVRRHEETHKGPKLDRLELMRSTNAMFEALLMLSNDEDGALRNLLAKVVTGPRVARAELDGVRISMWHATGRDAKRISEAAGNAVYIADGHHRFETAVAFRDERPKADRTLAMIVPSSDPGLVVLPTHRIINGGSMSEGQLRLAVGEIYDVIPIEADVDLGATMARMHERGGGVVVVLPQGQNFVLTEKVGSTLPRFTPAQDTAIMRLDVARADTLVVNPLRRLAGLDTTTLTYSADVVDVKAQIDAGATAGVLVTPTSLSEVMSVADEGGVMPPKSTFFYPKVPSGLVIMSWS